jgi:hypothetical protein
MPITRTIQRGTIKSIQRGSVLLDATGGANANISPVDITKCVLLVSGTGLITATGVLAARSFQIAFNNDSQIRVTAQQGTGTTTTGTAAWQVVEYY